MTPTIKPEVGKNKEILYTGVYVFFDLSKEPVCKVSDAKTRKNKIEELPREKTWFEEMGNGLDRKKYDVYLTIYPLS